MYVPRYTNTTTYVHMITLDDDLEFADDFIHKSPIGVCRIGCIVNLPLGFFTPWFSCFLRFLLPRNIYSHCHQLQHHPIDYMGYIEARATWKTTHKRVCEETQCVHCLIPGCLLALMILPFKIILFSHVTDAGQPYVFVRMVEVLVNLDCNSLMRAKCWLLKIFTSRKY